MDKEPTFEKDGRFYKVLQADIKLTRHKPPRIQRQGDSKCITFLEALQNGLICEVPPAEKIDLFPDPRQKDLGMIEEKSTIADPHQPKCLESPKTRSTGDNIYFMPVDPLRAQVFLAHGLIYPAVYDKAGLSGDFHDSQRLTPARLTLYAMPQPLHRDQLLLKILLHQDEIATAERNGDVLHLATPLPISRLAGIEVPPAAGGLDRYIDGWVKPDVPVPRHLFSSTAVPLSPDQENPNGDFPPGDAQPNPDIAESIIRFDRYLGVMAFLRNAARYFSEKTGHYADYPAVFFLVCERMLNKPGLAPSGCPAPDPLLLALLGFDMEMTDTAKSVLSLANSQEPYIDKEKARNLAGEIYKATTGKKEVLEEAFKALFSGNYRSAISKLQGSDIPAEAAILAGLFKFSVRHSNDYRTVKQSLHDDWSNQSLVHLFLAALGAYYGYTALEAQETALYSVHPLICHLIEEHPEIKFHLNTYFERELIEAIYRRAFFPNAPLQDSSPLFSTVTKPPASPIPERPWGVSDATYTVQDLMVRQYQVTRIGRFIQRFKAWKRDFIDEKSRVGRYLMSECFFLADEYEVSRKAGKQTLRYRITKSKVIDLIMEGKIAVDPVLEAALKEDETRDSAQ